MKKRCGANRAHRSSKAWRLAAWSGPTLRHRPVIYPEPEHMVWIAQVLSGTYWTMARRSDQGSPRASPPEDRDRSDANAARIHPLRLRVEASLEPERTHFQARTLPPPSR